MCCRFQLKASPEMIETINRRKPQQMKIDGEIFPGDVVPVVASSKNKTPSAFAMQWGYHLNNKLVFNARSETAGEKKIFREGLLYHRCIIPASCYYEWNEKKKYRVQRAEQETFLAGIYRMEERPVFTILTRDPGENMLWLHPRMPVILSEDLVDAWINPDADPQKLLQNSITEMTVEMA